MLRNRTRTGGVTDHNDRANAPALVIRRGLVCEQRPGQMVMYSRVETHLLQLGCDFVHAQGENIQPPSEQINVDLGGCRHLGCAGGN